MNLRPTSFPVYSLGVNLLRLLLPLMLRKVYIYTETSAPEKPCLWIFFILPYHHASNVNDVFTFMLS